MSETSKQTIRILQARYKTARLFEQNLYSLDEHWVIYYPTRIPVEVDDPVIIEILFPGLPHRILLRGLVSQVKPEEPAAMIRIADEDHGTMEFVVKVAKGGARPEPSAQRRHDRIPLEVQVDWQAHGSGEVVVAETDDLSASGVQIRTDDPPPIGTAVTLRLGADDPALQSTVIRGQVAWVRRDESFVGMGVQFSAADREERKRIRDYIRRIMERGRVEMEVE